MYERVEGGQSGLFTASLIQPVSLTSKHFTGVDELQFVMSVRSGVYFCDFSQHCTMCCLYSTMALYPKAEMKKKHFPIGKKVFLRLFFSMFL